MNTGFLVLHGNELNIFLSTQGSYSDLVEVNSLYRSIICDHFLQHNGGSPAS